MNDVLDGFLKDLCASRITQANTIAAYRSDLAQFAIFLSDQGVGDLAVLRPADMQAFCDWLHGHGYSAATIARRVTALRAFGTYLVQAGLVQANPADGLQRPRVMRTTPETLSGAQIQALRAATLQQATPEGWRDRALLEVLAAVGLRASEIVTLDLDHITLEANELVRHDANGAGVSVHLPPDVVMALATYLQLGRPHLLKRDTTEPALFLNVRGQRLTRQGCWEIVQKYARQLGFEGVSLETLRQAAHYSPKMSA